LALFWLERCPDRCRSGGVPLAAAKPPGGISLDGLATMVQTGGMSGASVYRIPSAQEVKQFTFEDRELI
jgi:hypothetical protein